MGLDGRAIDEKGMCVPWNRQKVNLYDYLERKANNEPVDLQIWTRAHRCQVVRVHQQSTWRVSTGSCCRMNCPS